MATQRNKTIAVVILCSFIIATIGTIVAVFFLPGKTLQLLDQIDIKVLLASLAVSLLAIIHIQLFSHFYFPHPQMLWKTIFYACSYVGTLMLLTSCTPTGSVEVLGEVVMRVLPTESTSSLISGGLWLWGFALFSEIVYTGIAGFEKFYGPL